MSMHFPETSSHMSGMFVIIKRIPVFAAFHDSGNGFVEMIFYDVPSENLSAVPGAIVTNKILLRSLMVFKFSCSKNTGMFSSVNLVTALMVSKVQRPVRSNFRTLIFYFQRTRKNLSVYP